MTDPKAISVPKFGSFKPKVAPPGPSIPIPQRKEDIDAERKHHHGRRWEKEEKRRRRGRLRSRSEERSRKRSPESEPSRKLMPEITQKQGLPTGVFFIDTKGDVKNVMYGGVHRYSVPPFQRYGAGYVLGVSLDLKIDRSYVDEKSVVLSKWRQPRARQKYIFSKVEKDKPRLLKIRPGASSEGQTAFGNDFVPLEASRGKTINAGSQIYNGESSGSDHEEPDYRSIHRKKGELQPVDRALQYASESDSSGSNAARAMDVDASTRQRNVELSQKVEQHPNDFEAWLELINHQDVLMRVDAGRRRVTRAEITSTAEIKIHMYEKALENAKSLEDREMLLLGLMTEGAKIWEVKSQADRWEEISKDNIDSLLLWTSYLNFKQTTFTSFRQEELKDLFLRRFELLSQAAINVKPDFITALYHQLLYVILRLTLFLRESGYIELAVAIWQGILEINFCAPDRCITKSDISNSFKDFWDSEVPRLGEDAAMGWRDFVENEGAPEIPDIVVDESHDSVKNSDIFRSWARAERVRSTWSHNPARTMDEVVEDDPYRVILFSDIEPFLLVLPAVERIRKSFIVAFLYFCRLPPMALTDDNDTSQWNADTFIRNDLLEYNAERLSREFSHEVHPENQQSSIVSCLDILFPNISRSPETIFQKDIWFHDEPWHARYLDGNGPLSYKWVRNALRQLTQRGCREDLAEYYLAFEFLNEVGTVKKVAKGLLKQNPSCLRLYNAYALIEWSRGNKDIARGVFSAALNLKQLTSNGEPKNDSILLWQSWSWSCLAGSDKDTALRLLLSIPDGKPDTSLTPTPTVILRAKQHLSSNRDFLFSEGDLWRSVTHAECLALLEYLTGTSNREIIANHQGDITSALHVYNTFSQTLTLALRPCAQSQQLLLQSAARLLFHHARIGPFRPSLLREQLTTYLTLFPQNTIFLSLYTWNESRLRVDNRVRTLLSNKILTEKYDCISSRLTAITFEIKYGTIHSVRSAFESALSTSPTPTPTSSSAGLWKFYILYCLHTPQFKEQTKDVWYRALKACPWAKELYVLGFERLGQDFGLGYGEMKGTWRIMGEKELRVHVDLEDSFEEIGDRYEVEEKGKMRMHGLRQ